MYVHYLHVSCKWRSGEGFLELESVVVSHHVDDKNRTLVLWKSWKGVKLLSHPSSLRNNNLYNLVWQVLYISAYSTRNKTLDPTQRLELKGSHLRRCLYKKKKFLGTKICVLRNSDLFPLPVEIYLQMKEKRPWEVEFELYYSSCTSQDFTKCHPPSDMCAMAESEQVFSLARPWARQCKWEKGWRVMECPMVWKQ